MSLTSRVERAERQPDLRRDQRHRPAETARRDAHDRELAHVDRRRAADEAGREAGVAPALVADDHDRDVRARPFFLRGERTSGGQRHGQRREVVRRHQSRANARRVEVAGRHAHERERVGHQAVEDGVPVADVGVVRVGEARDRESGLVRSWLNRPIRSSARPASGRNSSAFDDREHRAVRANAEREHQHGDDREAGRLEHARMHRSAKSCVSAAICSLLGLTRRITEIDMITSEDGRRLTAVPRLSPSPLPPPQERRASVCGACGPLPVQTEAAQYGSRNARSGRSRALRATDRIGTGL